MLWGKPVESVSNSPWGSVIDGDLVAFFFILNISKKMAKKVIFRYILIWGNFARKPD